MSWKQLKAWTDERTSSAGEHSQHFSLGLGGLFAVNFVQDALAPSYAGHHPTVAMGFVRLKLNEGLKE